MNELQETDFRGQILQARLTERRSPRRTGSGPAGLGPGSNNPRHVEFPLRILVQSDMVGAIIGRGGQTIRQITQQTRYAYLYFKNKPHSSISLILEHIQDYWLSRVHCYFPTLKVLVDQKRQRRSFILIEFS